MAAPPIPSITGGDSGPAWAGAGYGAYGASSGAGAWTVNLKGTQAPTGMTAVNWLMIAALAGVGYLAWRKFK